jgi:hypothetical protein
VDLADVTVGRERAGSWWGYRRRREGVMAAVVGVLPQAVAILLSRFLDVAEDVLASDEPRSLVDLLD